MRELAGRTAVVTGGASGIGLSLANRLAAEGMNLVVADIDSERLHTTVERLRAAGSKVIGTPTDVSSAPALDALATAVTAEFGLPDVVCANAGVNRFARFQDLSLDDWQWVIGVNLMGVVHTARSFLPLLLQGHNGCLAITASMASLMCPINAAAYNAAKHGALAIAESLYAELFAEGRSDIGVTLLCPGPVRTDIAHSTRHRSGAAVEQTEADRRFEQLLTTSGMDPWHAADLLVDAIKEDRRFVFTHPELARRAVEQRSASMLDGLSDAV
jgi:NAD(P)-dependent dehydrogenase (short-subunit alcohol dehydrogenase family)